MYLYDIIDDFRPEDTLNECKARLNRDNYIGWMKTICGFVNTKGGSLFLGVKDKTYELIGYNLKELDNEKLYLTQMISNHFKTTIEYTFESIPYIINGEKRYILKVSFHESRVKPVVLNTNGFGYIFIRQDGKTSPATTENIILMAKSSAFPYFDNQLTNIKFNRKNFNDLFNFYKERNDSKELTEKLLESIGFFDQNKFLKKGSLLFSDDCNADNTLVVCNNFGSLTRGVNLVNSSINFKGNLINAYKFIYEYLNQRMNHGFIKTKDSRIDIDAFPSRALFESIINALAHRDYLIDGSQVSVDLMQNRLVITSPGSLFEKEDIPPTYNFYNFASVRRNKLICDVFILCKAMEAKGTGFEKILKDYENADSRHKPFIFSKNNQFSIVLPDLTYPSGIDISDEAITIINKGLLLNINNKYTNKILAFCYSKEKSLKEITSMLDVSNSTYFKNNIINPLADNKLLLVSKVKNKLCYKTNTENVYLN